MLIPSSSGVKAHHAQNGRSFNGAEERAGNRRKGLSKLTDNQKQTEKVLSEPARSTDVDGDQNAPPLASDRPVTAGDTANNENAIEDTKTKKPQPKGWFSHTFFLATVIFAMALTYFNTWIGPDAPFKASDYIQEDLEHQQAMITKLEMRLRRAEIFQNPDNLFKARINLSDAMFHLVKDDRALSLLRSAADSITAPMPDNSTYQILLSNYERTQRYKEAAEFVSQWEKRMPADAVFSPHLYSFYSRAAKASAYNLSRSEARRYEEMLQRLRLIPRNYWQPPKNDALSKPMPAPGSEFVAACKDTVAGNFESARHRFESIRNRGKWWAPDSESTVKDPEDKDDSVKSHIMLALLSMQLDEITPQDEGFRQAYNLAKQLKGRLGDSMQSVLVYARFQYYDRHPEERFQRHVFD